MKFKEDMQQTFEIMDFKEMVYFLGTEIKRGKKMKHSSVRRSMQNLIEKAQN